MIIDGKVLIGIDWSINIDNRLWILTSNVLVGSGAQLIKDMEIPVALILANHTRFLEQEVRQLNARSFIPIAFPWSSGNSPAHLSAYRLTSPTEHDLHVLPETGGVPVTNRGGVAERLQKRIRLQDDVLDVLKRARRCLGILESR